MSDHEWCRDVSRDEAVRAAEDAAAVPSIQHRDLPEQVALLWASLGDIIGRVVRLEGEMDAGQDDLASPAEGLRTERVTLEVTHCATKSIRDLAGRDVRGWLETFGESVRVVDTTAEAMQQSAAWDGAREAYSEGIARVKAERDAAKEECERLRQSVRDTARVRDFWHQLCATREEELKALKARVAELERDRRPATWQEEEAAVEGAWLLCGLEPDWPSDEPGTIVRHAESMRREVGRLRARVAELEAAAAPAANAGGEQQPPRGWLTEQERGALERAFDLLCDDDGDQPLAGTVQQLLARSTPPKVKGPTGWAYDAHDMAWIAAIRAAGGEVE